MVFGPCLPWQNLPFKQVHLFHAWLFLVGEILPPHLLLLLLMQVPADDGETKKFHPLDSFAREEFHPLDSYASEDFLAIQKDPIALALAITVPLPIPGMDEESLLDKEPKLAQFDDIAGSSHRQHSSFYKLLVCSPQTPALPLACTIYGESPYLSSLSFMIKSCYNDDGKSKDNSDSICPDPEDYSVLGCLQLP